MHWYVDVYLMPLDGSCVWILTLTVSRGYPTRTPAAPFKANVAKLRTEMQAKKENFDSRNFTSCAASAKIECHVTKLFLGYGKSRWQAKTIRVFRSQFMKSYWMILRVLHLQQRQNIPRPPRPGLVSDCSLSMLQSLFWLYQLFLLHELLMAAPPNIAAGPTVQCSDTHNRFLEWMIRLVVDAWARWKITRDT